MNIKTVELSKTYGKGETKVKALRPCTFSVESGEQLAITGASGSGKSTLLHLLGGLERPTGGSVLFDGQDLLKEKDAKLAKFRLRNIGFVFQAYNLLPELTAYENILLPALLEGVSADKGYLDDILESLGLEDRIHHLPGELSGGQQQRVAIARALTNKPQLVLCDEPTGNLDSKNSESVIELLNTTARELGLTLVVVTHDENIAAKYPRVITICDGLIGGDV